MAALGYLAAEAKHRCRECWQEAIQTQLCSDMKWVAPYGAWNHATCPQGEPLAWLGYDSWAGEHWFGPERGGTSALEFLAPRFDPRSGRRFIVRVAGVRHDQHVGRGRQAVPLGFGQEWFAHAVHAHWYLHKSGNALFSGPFSLSS